MKTLFQDLLLKKQARAAPFETHAVWEKLFEDGALYLSDAVKFLLKFSPIATW